MKKFHNLSLFTEGAAKNDLDIVNINKASTEFQIFARNCSVAIYGRHVIVLFWTVKSGKILEKGFGGSQSRAGSYPSLAPNPIWLLQGKHGIA